MPTKSVAVGAGFVVLDLVINKKAEGAVQVRAGGSCVNVLTVLSTLGWQSHVVGRIGIDEAAKALRDDLESFSVSTDQVVADGSIGTPAIVELIRSHGSKSTHSYSLHCPHCGAFLPRYRPIKKQWVPGVTDAIPTAGVFYFDRLSPAIVELAEHYRAGEATVLFEPSGLREGKLFDRAIGASHIVKFSQQRIPEFRRTCTSQEQLVVQTLGSLGLRYRIGSMSWRHLPAFTVSNPIDEAGCGDWCSAGILHQLAAAGGWSRRPERPVLENALRFGEALAAVNCRFPGARGAMYQLTSKEILAYTQDVLEGEQLDSEVDASIDAIPSNLARLICAKCDTDSDARIDL